jgi:N-methylhydantoinase A/oxoprolinase/acetone carboxylase beta subunit
MERLINIDNGGTLTDICVWDGQDFTYTKTLTTPFDLSKCLFEGIAKASVRHFGESNLEALLHSTKHIRYSTTQGTNALVERKGPRIGLITDDSAVAGEMRATESEAALFDALVGSRVAVVDPRADAESLAFDLVQRVNRLTTDGAARIVVAVGAADGRDEARLRSILLRKFPRHLLGSVPILYAWELTADRLRPRRIWSGVINAFLHPTMERFLYNAEDRLRSHRVRNPLLIYRNDGASSRVAKSVALKTYSSGPRGGLEGTRALAEAYGLRHVLMIDVGGTTTDVGSVKDFEIAVQRRGSARGVPISFPMSDVRSSGVGGSSIIGVDDGRIVVGPESVGAAPGPACFGFGGKTATITDVNLLLGVLDPDTYLDGGFTLDAERSKTVITATVAEPLGISLEEALVRMEAAYFATMAAAFADSVEEETTIAAFGGAGPMSACGAARLTGVKTVLVPKLAAVFSAFGISFSDIGQNYEVVLPNSSAEGAQAVHDALLERAERDMFQEGYELATCALTWSVAIEEEDGSLVSESPYVLGDPPAVGPGRHGSLKLKVTARLPRAELSGDESLTPRPAVASGTRRVRSSASQVDEVAIYSLVNQKPGATAAGPAIVEGPFFTARVLSGWRLDITAGGDLMLTDLS